MNVRGVISEFHEKKLSLSYSLSPREEEGDAIVEHMTRAVIEQRAGKEGAIIEQRTVDEEDERGARGNVTAETNNSQHAMAETNNYQH